MYAFGIGVCDSAAREIIQDTGAPSFQCAIQLLPTVPRIALQAVEETVESSCGLLRLLHPIDGPHDLFHLPELRDARMSFEDDLELHPIFLGEILFVLFQELLRELMGMLRIQAPQLSEVKIEVLDDMELVDDDRNAWELPLHHRPISAVHVCTDGFNQRFRFFWHGIEPSHERRIPIICENAQELVMGDIRERDDEITPRKTVFVDAQDEWNRGPSGGDALHEFSGGANERMCGCSAFFGHGGEASISDLRQHDRTKVFRGPPPVDARHGLPKDAASLAAEVSERHGEHHEHLIAESMFYVAHEMFLNTCCGCPTASTAGCFSWATYEKKDHSVLHSHPVEEHFC